MQILRRSKKILFINHWKATEALVSLKDITIYLKTHSKYRKLFFICFLLWSISNDIYNGDQFLYKCMSSRINQKDWISKEVDIYSFMWCSWDFKSWYIDKESYFFFTKSTSTLWEKKVEHMNPVFRFSLINSLSIFYLLVESK